MTDELLPPSRRDRLHQRRSWRRRVALASGAALILSGGIGTAWFLADDSSSSSGAPTTNGVSTSNGGPKVSSEVITGLTGEIDELPAGRPLTHEDPLRLWVGGDSLSGAIGPVIGQLSEDSGVVRALVDFKVSSGLATRVRDWPEYATELIAEEKPEAIVFMVGANDAIVVGNDNSWEADYRDKVREMMDLLVGGDAKRTVFWVGSPPMRLGDREEGIIELNRVYQEEALLRPEVIYVDAYTMLEGPEGGYSSSIFIEGQGTLYVRSGDGVHLTGAGAEWLGFNVWQLIDRRWDVGTYERPDLPIDYRTEPGGNTGCCEEPGPTYDDPDSTDPVTSSTIDCAGPGTCETTTSSTPNDTTTTVPTETTASESTASTTPVPPPTSAPTTTT